jgi:hypothetical protein
MYFSMPSFCPLIVLVFRQKRRLSLAFFFPAKAEGASNASPEVAVMVSSTFLLFMDGGFYKSKKYPVFSVSMANRADEASHLKTLEIFNRLF